MVDKKCSVRARAARRASRLRLTSVSPDNICFSSLRVLFDAGTIAIGVLLFGS